ncbi:nuclear transport factor 2 family protein [Acaryochloris sp. IP29b_bin.137]|uniref:nuclear transport factor 2 family protein n=1 Tax=Acaryochloris sp. IP29b_bin.137 TaxID=2969217 RepID=UPI0026379C23|nr:nuclear transport factor 2 family protein [Acaryochloris sp. IP29b_bin.137]
MNSTQVYASQKQVTDLEYSAIFDVLRCYYNGLYRCDPKLLSTVFHPNAQYFTASDGELLHLDMNTYFPIVEQRSSPESSQESYEFSVDSIEFVGPVTAIAHMRSSMLSKDYIDLLTLVQLEGEWKIITKVFHSTNHADA